MCQGLEALLKKHTDIEVVGQAHSGQEAVQLARKLKPDIILMDVCMPEMDGIDATREIIKGNPDIKILALSAFSHKHLVEQTLKAGAIGFITKEAVFDELTLAVRSAYQNKVYLSQDVKKTLLSKYVKQLQSDSDSESSVLTGREYEIIRLLTQGKSSKEIAMSMKISAKTVDAARRRIMEKLGINSLAALIKYAIHEGIAFLDIRSRA